MSDTHAPTRPTALWKRITASPARAAQPLQILLGNRSLVLLVGAFAALTVAEWGYVTALAIDALRRDGPIAVGLVGFRLFFAAIGSVASLPYVEQHPGTHAHRCRADESDAGRSECVARRSRGSPRGSPGPSRPRRHRLRRLSTCPVDDAAGALPYSEGTGRFGGRNQHRENPGASHRCDDRRSAARGSVTVRSVCRSSDPPLHRGLDHSSPGPTPHSDAHRDALEPPARSVRGRPSRRSESPMSARS